MHAYTTIRRSKFFPDKKELNRQHAENGMLVMTFEGLLFACLYAFVENNQFTL